MYYHKIDLNSVLVSNYFSLITDNQLVRSIYAR